MPPASARTRAVPLAPASPPNFPPQLDSGRPWASRNDGASGISGLGGQLRCSVGGVRLRGEARAESRQVQPGLGASGSSPTWTDRCGGHANRVADRPPVTGYPRSETSSDSDGRPTMSRLRSLASLTIGESSSPFVRPLGQHHPDERSRRSRESRLLVQRRRDFRHGRRHVRPAVGTTPCLRDDAVHSTQRTAPVPRSPANNSCAIRRP